MQSVKSNIGDLLDQEKGSTHSTSGFKFAKAASMLGYSYVIWTSLLLLGRDGDTMMSSESSESHAGDSLQWRFDGGDGAMPPALPAVCADA